MKLRKPLSLTLCAWLLTACGSSNNSSSSRVEADVPNNPPVVSATAANSPVVNSPVMSVAAANPPVANSSAVNVAAANPPVVNSSAVNVPAANPPVVNASAVNPAIEVRETDEAIFNRLSSENFGSQDWLRINLEGKEILLSATTNTKVSDQAMKPLRDSDDKLVGYVGYLAGTQTEDDPLRPDDPRVTRKAFALLGVDEKQLTLPAMSFVYEGEMHYFYDNQANIYTAGVSANYVAASKKVEMTISGRDADHSRLWTLSTTAQSDGKVAGVLIENRQRRGEFDGGFYGKEGKFLVGKTQFEDANNQDGSWKGVVHTIAK